MPSLIPSYEYDIFISYRHNDNRSGWVTEFGKNLKEEIASTIKDPVSVYFDSNPHDGLLETHHVDKSLEGKLKCLILVPIISNTYCDVKSFAWQQEFCAFNKLASADRFGRDIKLNSGNVASRILPIKINNLEAEDLGLLQKELGGMLRAIDFIFRSPGVNRPLRVDDRRDENQNKLVYRDQINKVAQAIKEITNGIRFPDRTEAFAALSEYHLDSLNQAIEKKPKQEINDKSIAVLPLVSLANDSSQEYFADGITENILIELANLPEIRVTSRTSIMRYKKTTKSAPEIAAELSVKYILEGSAQTNGNKVKINIQLIDAIQDDPVWSKVFVENMDDIFTIQSHVAEVVARELSSSINPKQAEKTKEAPTKNLEAYDLFLKGRHAFNQWGVDGYKTATEYFKQAIAKDPDFQLAYSALASSYSARMSWNGDLSPGEAQKNIEVYLNESWRKGPTDNDYLTKAFVEFFITKDFTRSEKLLLQAIELNPNNSTVLYTYSYLLFMMGRFAEAFEFLNRAKIIDPLTVPYFNYQTISYYLTNQFDDAVATLQEALRLYPSVLRLYDFLGRIYLTMGKYAEAVDALASGLRTSKLRPPSMLAYLSSSYWGLKNFGKAKDLLDELTKRSGANEKGVNIYVMHIYNAMGDLANAQHWLAKAKSTNDVDLIWWNVDPLLQNLREAAFSERPPATSPDMARPDFAGAEKFMKNIIENDLPKLQYHNTDHIYDVLHSALTIAESENVSEHDVKIIRMAALFHDVGFIHAAKGHEEKGAEMAMEILPKYGIEPADIEVICRMILATRIPQSPTTKLEKILCDADLDYLGRADFYEIGGRLLEELKAHGILETEREWNLVQKTFLESHRYHTEYGKANREAEKKERLAEIAAKLRAK